MKKFIGASPFYIVNISNKTICQKATVLYIGRAKRLKQNIKGAIADKKPLNNYSKCYKLPTQRI
jgi:hypothetical protein